jgi:uncharacterized protein (DUF305 family)
MHARPPLTLIAGLAAVLTLAACGSSGSSATGAATTPNVAATATQPAPAAPTATGTAAPAGRAGDISFAQLMIPHHQQALEMAYLAQDQAASPEVRNLAQQIKAAQDPEIQQMVAWLAAWGAPEQMAGASAPESMDHSGMDMGGMTSAGMMSNEDMRKLTDARGADFDRMWLQMMTAHHQGAVTMARQVLATTSDAGVKKLADAVVAGQTDEITQMQKLLAE